MFSLGFEVVSLYHFVKKNKDVPKDLLVKLEECAIGIFQACNYFLSCKNRNDAESKEEARKGLPELKLAFVAADIAFEIFNNEFRS